MSEIPLHEGLPADETKLVDIRKFKQLAKAYIPPSRAFQHELRDFNGKWNKTFDNETEEKLKMEGRETTRAKALVDMIFAKSVTVEVTQSNLTFRQGGGGGICGCFAPKKPPISVPVGKGEAELVDLGENRQLYFDVGHPFQELAPRLIASPLPGRHRPRQQPAPVRCQSQRPEPRGALLPDALQGHYRAQPGAGGQEPVPEGPVHTGDVRVGKAGFWGRELTRGVFYVAGSICEC
ncbi:hypothetical protein DFJ74DRAFT_697503 [Hyaloraphidium curvatum]|nr:hypothetical protein DFJ74DRAFT_697503 [Hyaloraphidium curvatum]